MFDKILIANRGEIACRIARTARRMGIATVAVYSEADANAMHVKACDEAYLIGPAPAVDSYLQADKILEVAKKSGAQAVHPGYGFMSENASFSKACKDAGIVFIGPPESAIISMGSKSEAKIVMTEAGVPLVPGYHGDDQSLETLKKESDGVGFPQLIKATAGGGGKGMRVVTSSDEFEAALTSCKRESKASFGDDKVLIERYLTAPRHVELQIFADTHGNAVHVFERDCSIQRRHQKVIEEAPAPGMTEELRAAMGKAAIDSAKAINYVGAGTVEFLLDTDGSFFFMEMNTRLQVEHPISEMISGQDLVEWQFLVASGEPLPLTQAELKINGHAFEARIYAESPENDFLPATGTLEYLKTPDANAHIRVDTGVQQGDEVSVYYDPMIAKLIVWDKDRDSALRQMKSALLDYQILGLSTNLEFLSKLFSAPAFAKADLDTGFIEKNEADLFNDKDAKKNSPPSEVMALTCLYELLQTKAKAKVVQSATADPFSPWGIGDGWQLNQDNFNSVDLEFNGNPSRIIAHYRGQGYELELNADQDQGGQHVMISGTMQNDNLLTAEIDGRKLSAVFVKKNQQISILFEGRVWIITVHDPRMDAMENEGQAGGLVAPMPGAVVAVEVKVGDEVKEGDSLVVVEAMKMEHSILAPKDGTVKEIYFGVGDQVEDGDELLSLDDKAAD
ncbi:acetyl/propionyl/methylcrotonyl-CoA carboxylase subunit alpha [Cocleimonas flava]|uniref:Biotin carboxylase n=1 Tax=Cocleimonas flava TaxID=634765 RepID=A0A4R1F143_9GAMM|nr:acetyl/propionyl/methylcrotonyl-CoA carboxylase subunit alpha [Cocleimonas flava]TCJ87553.1 3-methylcrotonoyl-CoA carboxylase alpha subunit [Cocleimonas flava]